MKKNLKMNSELSFLFLFMKLVIMMTTNSNKNIDNGFSDAKVKYKVKYKEVEGWYKQNGNGLLTTLYDILFVFGVNKNGIEYVDNFLKKLGILKKLIGLYPKGP